MPEIKQEKSDKNSLDKQYFRALVFNMVRVSDEQEFQGSMYQMDTLRVALQSEDKRNYFTFLHEPSNMEAYLKLEEKSQARLYRNNRCRKRRAATTRKLATA